MRNAFNEMRKNMSVNFKQDLRKIKPVHLTHSMRHVLTAVIYIKAHVATRDGRTALFSSEVKFEH